MMNTKRRRLITSLLFSIALLAGFYLQQVRPPAETDAPAPIIAPGSISTTNQAALESNQPALEALGKLAVKGRSPKTGYSRDLFGNGWQQRGACDVRNQILARDLTNLQYQSDGCTVLSGILQDPYSGKRIAFVRGATTSQAVQIDHVVALSDAWQKGAQQLTPELRVQFANDPLNLITVDGPANMNKGDGDAATWLPANKGFRCSYVARQVTVKLKYSLWATQAEKDAIQNILKACPNQPLAA